MKPYDAGAPLIFIHIPKTAGTSVRGVIEDWFTGRFYRHYYNKDRAQPPQKLNLADPKFTTVSPVIYGHFNRDRGLGIEHYYPDVRQFITLLRDPFDLHISRYSYQRGVKETGGLVLAPLEDTLENHILKADLRMLNHFPRQVTKDNFKDILEEYFVEIGFVEHLQQSLLRIAGKLGHRMAAGVPPHLNKSKRDEQISESLRDWFRERWSLEYTVYDYAYQQFQTAAHPDAENGQIQI